VACTLLDWVYPIGFLAIIAFAGWAMWRIAEER
jgi:hypothetical protein